MVLSSASRLSWPRYTFRGARQCLSRRYATTTAAPETTTSPQYDLSDADRSRLRVQRNIGVSAHIDSGKTTLTERILYYTGRIGAIHEVRGRDNVGAKMDSMDLEREKGITIQSAATFCDWEMEHPITKQKDKFAVNIIDTPGHVDFTIEVERALRVLDGAILVLAKLRPVDRQMRRYNVPRISFVNKMDRPGANPWRIIDQIRTKLRKPAAAVQIPIGREDEFAGVVDLVHWRALYNEGPKGRKDRELVEALSDVDDEIGDLVLMEEEPTNEQLEAGIRRATVACKFSPVFPLLDGVAMYLPRPDEKEVLAHDTNLPANSPQLEEGKYGQLTYMRIYQGTLKKGSWIFNARTGKKVKVPSPCDVDNIGPGEICAIFGVDCASGDSFTDGSSAYSMTPMFVPEPVISLSIKPKGQETPNFSRALSRFNREDPTFKVHIDKESKETIISGMGELHLEIYVERMKREYNVECITGKPQVAWRETINQRTEFSYTHKKQTGGAGQFAKVVGYIEPCSYNAADGEPDRSFTNSIMGGTIPSHYIPAVERGFYEAMEKGTLAGYPIVGVRFVLTDGAFHTVDSSELAFKLCTIYAFREAFAKARAQLLEPVMKVDVVAPAEFQSAVVGGLNTRRGTIIDSEVRDDEFVCESEVALNDMFGYSNQLRGSTQGKGEFSMEYKNYAPALPSLQQQLSDEYKKKLAQKK
ncbi:elongation factor G, mitochondrial [Flagelloscypha sp. PMI_526]|nr:elongation factor G, mitochondrial [Flagelloscypha sp. PMI_526]